MFGMNFGTFHYADLESRRRVRVLVESDILPVPKAIYTIPMIRTSTIITMIITGRVL